MGIRCDCTERALRAAVARRRVGGFPHRPTARSGAVKLAGGVEYAPGAFDV
jgi:hypothetical protein